MTEQPTAGRYVAGTLTDEEVARFEESMIERPDLAADVNVRRRIKAGLSLLEERRELDTLLAPPVNRPQPLRYAAAAAVLVIAVGLWSVWRMQPATPVQTMFASADAGMSKVATSFMLVRTRSAQSPAFSVRRNDGLVRLQILIDDPAGAPFTARIGDEEISITRLIDGFAEVYLDPRKLESRGYTLALKSRSGAEQLFPFALTVTP
ncbi:MAG TPA: hypothetical protein VEW08_00380 [Steroidobacteraceae bacterium]|nr:hypothetical protein [Steroidobacteraceae bacterium]